MKERMFQVARTDEEAGRIIEQLKSQGYSEADIHMLADKEKAAGGVLNNGRTAMEEGYAYAIGGPELRKAVQESGLSEEEQESGLLHLQQGHTLIITPRDVVRRESSFSMEGAAPASGLRPGEGAYARPESGARSMDGAIVYRDGEIKQDQGDDSTRGARPEAQSVTVENRADVTTGGTIVTPNRSFGEPAHGGSSSGVSQNNTQPKEIIRDTGLNTFKGETSNGVDGPTRAAKMGNAYNAYAQAEDNPSKLVTKERDQIMGADKPVNLGTSRPASGVHIDPAVARDRSDVPDYLYNGMQSTDIEQAADDERLRTRMENRQPAANPTGIYTKPVDNEPLRAAEPDVLETGSDPDDPQFR